MNCQNDQSLKKDAGKVRLTLIPLRILYGIAAVREFGVQKYQSEDSWKKVDIKRYRDAAWRHWIRYLLNPTGLDDESGLPHIYHVACNIAFLCELEGLEDVKWN